MDELSLDFRGPVNDWNRELLGKREDYCQHYRTVSAILYLNLDSGRYEVSGGCLSMGTTWGVYDTGLDESRFTVQSLRKSGR